MDRSLDSTLLGGGAPALATALAVASIGTKTRILTDLQRRAGNQAVQQMFERASDPVGLAVRPPLERRLGADLNSVRVHSDDAVDRLTRAVGARTFTSGRHVYFRSGEYDPSSDQGRRLIAHEAAHVVQQEAATKSTILDSRSDRHESAAAAFEAGSALVPVAARAPAIKRMCDDGAVEGVPVTMPRLTGNGERTEVEVMGGCDDLDLHGQTNAAYNGGRFQIAGRKVNASTDCQNCGDQPCLHMTGTLVTKYTVKVSITMPPVPTGLTKCEADKVNTFLTKVLLPHEKDHEKRFKTYNGQTKNPVDITGCGKDDLEAQVEAIQASEDSQRQADANALSADIDPFDVTFDCLDCDS